MKIFRRKLTLFMLIIGVSLLLSSVTLITAVHEQSTTQPPTCGYFEKYVVQNGELRIQQLYQGDSLEGLFKADEFNFDEFNLNPIGYTTNTTSRHNYAYDQLEFQENLVWNITSTLNGLQVVVVIKNIDSVWNAYDSYCADNNQQNQCTNPIDFLVKDGWIDIPPLGNDPNAPQPGDIELLGVYPADEFDHELFDMDPQGYLDNTSNINYVNSASIEIGGIKITNTGLEGKHVVLVFRDHSTNSQGDFIQAEKGFCNDGDSQGPFDSVTFGVQPGDILEYEVTIEGTFGNNGTEDGVPLFDMRNSDGSEFRVKNGDKLKVTIVSLPSFDDSVDTTPTTISGSTLKILQDSGKSQGPMDLVIRMESKTQVISETNGFGFVLPLEFIDLALNNPNKFYEMFNSNETNAGTAQSNNGTSGGDRFNPFSNILESTETTIAFGSEFTDEDGGNVTFKFIYDIDTGVVTQIFMSRTQAGTPDVSLAIDLVTDLTALKERLNNDTEKNIITTTPGFESILLLLGLIGFVFYKKRNF